MCLSGVLPFLRHAASVPGGGDGVVETLQRGVVVVEDGLQHFGREFVRVNPFPVLGYRGCSSQCRAWRSLTVPAGSRTRGLVFDKVWNHLTYRARIALYPSVGYLPRPGYIGSCTSFPPHLYPSGDCRSQHGYPSRVCTSTALHGALTPFAFYVSLHAVGSLSLTSALAHHPCTPFGAFIPRCYFGRGRLNSSTSTRLEVMSSMLAPWDRGLKFGASRLDGITTKPQDIHQLVQDNRNAFRRFPFPAVRASLEAADGQIDFVQV